MSRALGGHYYVSASRKTFKPAPGCGAWLGSTPRRAMLCGFQECDLPGKPSPGPQTCNALREESKQGRNSLFCIPKRQFPELSCLSSAFLAGNVSLIHVCVFSLLSLLLIVDSGGTVVLVSQDGIQRPPLRFPRGGHLLQFLSCLENGLLPHGQLDPPLWSQRGKVGTPKLGLFLSPRHCGFLLMFPCGVSQNRADGEDALPNIRGCCILNNPPPETKKEGGLEIQQFGLAHGLEQLNKPFRQIRREVVWGCWP